MSVPELENDTLVEVTIRGYYWDKESVDQYCYYDPEVLYVCVDPFSEENGDYTPMAIDMAAVVKVEVIEPEEPPHSSVVLSGDGVSFQRIGDKWVAPGGIECSWEQIIRPIKFLHVAS